MSTSQGVPTTYYYEPAYIDFLSGWSVYMAGLTNPPLIQSISWGADEPGIPLSYVQSIDVNLQKMV